VHHPLKQGLRHTLKRLEDNLPVCTSASSIKTRIKTFFALYPFAVLISVRVHHPLKQGLRLGHNLAARSFLNTFVRVHHPLKQGLRLDDDAEASDGCLYECIIH